MEVNETGRGESDRSVGESQLKFFLVVIVAVVLGAVDASDIQNQVALIQDGKVSGTDDLSLFIQRNIVFEEENT